MTDGGDGLSRGGPTHYEILDVRVDASVEEIRQAYRTKAKTAHPDQGGDNATFRRLLEAYQTLTNPLRRREYDDRLDVVRPSARRSGGGGTTSTPTWSRSRGTPEDAGWSGTDGGFTGDVEFPAWLRGVTDEPWADAERRTEATAQAADEPPTTRPADVLWWWPEPAAVPPRLAGQVVVTAAADEVVAINGFTGHEVWRAEMPAPVGAPITLAGDDTVVAWTANGWLHGLEVSRGVTRWQVPLAPPNAGGVTLINDKLVLAVDDALIGIDPTTGQQRWHSPLNNMPTVAIVGVEGVAVVGTKRGIEAIEARKGRARWRAPSRVPINLPMCGAAGSVWVVGGQGRLHRLDIATGAGTGLWDAGSTFAGLVSDGHILYATVVGPPQLVAVDPSGSVRWSHGLTAASPEPALIAGTAYVAETSDQLTAVDLLDGRPAGAVSLPFEPFGPPVGFVDRLILQERGGRLWCVDAPRPPA
jgi:outer membrane protein assembly factor BamB